MPMASAQREHLRKGYTLIGLPAPMRDRAWLLRTGLLAILLGGLGSWAAERGWLDVSPTWPLYASLVGLILAFLGAPFLGLRGWGTTREASVDVAKDGTFTWRPAGESQPVGFGVGSTRHRHDVIPMRRQDTQLRFSLPEDADPRLVQAAIKSAARVARKHPRVDRAKARAEWRDVVGPRSRLVVRLTLEGLALDDAGAKEAAQQYAEALLAVLTKKSVDARSH